MAKRAKKVKRPVGVKGRKAPKAKKVSSSDRADAFLVAYEHGLANNSPRNVSELAELRAILGKVPHEHPLSKEEVETLKSVYSGTSRLGWETSIPPVNPESFEVKPGLSVPATVNVMQVPDPVVRAHPELRGLRFLEVGNKLVFVDENYVIRHVAVAGSSKSKPRKAKSKKAKRAAA